jgi:hypothetical protein
MKQVVLLEGFEVRSHRVDLCKTQIKISNRRSKLNKQYSYSENESELGEESPWGEPYGLGVIESTSWALQKIPSDITQIKATEISQIRQAWNGP